MNGNLYNPKVYIYFTIAFFPLAVLIALCLDPLFTLIGLNETAKIILGTPSGIGILFTIFNFFDKQAWKWAIFRYFGIVSIPNLGGRWKGTVHSSHNGKTKVDAILEIHQTYSKMCVSLYTATSESKSTIAGFLKDEAGQITLSYLYQNKPRLLAVSTMTAQQGSALLKVLKGGKLLDGCYYNNGRERSTYGEVNFEWAQKEILHSFS